MSKISLYPLDSTIDPEDKVIGTDGADGADNGVTKNYSIATLGAYINALGVESVSTSDGTFIDLTPNAPTIGNVIVTADLSATGTPSSSTFLRGDNTWSQAVKSVTTVDGSFISLQPDLVETGDVIVSADLSATGTADSTTFLRGDNTWATAPSGSTYNLTSDQNSVNVDINLTQTPLGDVDTVSLIAGTNIQLVDDNSNNITINCTATSGIDGSGTANYLPVWQDSDTLTDSFLQAQSNTLSVGVLAMEWDTTLDGENIQLKTSSVSRLKVEDTTVTVENSSLNVTGGDIYSAGFVQAGTSAEVADVANVGAIRYRSDANNSYQEMSMQTGASTYAWVVIKQNSW
jgi:hypothetical protein